MTPQQVVETARQIVALGTLDAPVVESACGCLNAALNSTRKFDAVEQFSMQSVTSTLARTARVAGMAMQGAARDVDGAGGGRGGRRRTIMKATDDSLDRLAALRIQRAVHATLRQFSRAAVSIVQGDGNDEEKAAILASAKCMSDAVICAAIASDAGTTTEPAESSIGGVAVAAVPEEVGRVARMVGQQACLGNASAWAAIEKCAQELEPMHTKDVGSAAGTRLATL